MAPVRDPGHVAVGTWSGGRFMHFGEELAEERLAALLRPGDGIDTVLSADTYGQGGADLLLGRALAGVARDEVSVVGAIGHDFYDGERDGPRGFPASPTRGCADPTSTRPTCAGPPSAAWSASGWSASTCCCCTTPTARATPARPCGTACPPCATPGSPA